MKNRVIISIATSTIFLACSTGNDITSNYYDDGIYFDPTYGIEVVSTEEEEKDTNALPDYAYSESFDYYDPNGVSAPIPTNGYYPNTNFGYSSYMPTIRLSFGYGNPYNYGRYGYGGYYGDYGYYGYGYGYPGYGYGGYGYGGYYPGYGYCPPPGYGDNGNNNINTGWIGNSLTENWSNDVYRTKVNGSKPGSRRGNGGGTSAYTGPKKTSGSITPTRLSQNNVSKPQEGISPERVANNTHSPNKGGQTLSTISNKEGSRVKDYYSSGITKEKNTVRTVKQSNYNGTSTQKRTNEQSVKQPKKYYQSNTSPKNNTYRSKSSSGSRSTSKPSYRIQTKPSSQSKSSNGGSYSPSRSSSGGSSSSSGGSRSSSGGSSGSTKSSGGRR